MRVLKSSFEQISNSEDPYIIELEYIKHYRDVRANIKIIANWITNFEKTIKIDSVDIQDFHSRNLLRILMNIEHVVTTFSHSLTEEDREQILDESKKLIERF